MNSLILKLVNIIVLIELIKLKKNYSLSQNYSFSLINLIVNQEKRSSFLSTFTRPKNLLSIINSISKEIELDSSTPISLINFNLLLLINSRLLNKSNLLFIIRLLYYRMISRL